MNIVVLEGYPLNPGDLSWDELKKLGNTKIYDKTKNEDALERIGNADAVFVNKTELTREVFENAPNLKYVGVLATGFDNIDVKSAKENNVVVTNVPSYGTSSVAQFVFALLMEMIYHVREHDQAVKKGEWEESESFCFWKYPLVELKDKKFGIIGYGRIGMETGKIAKAFGMKVLAHTRTPDKSLEDENLKFVDLDELFKESDFISLHSPLTKETEGMINKKAINKMKKNAMIINTARGSLIVEEDLAYALNIGRIKAAASDVLTQEPPSIDNPLLKAKNMIVTPHIAWAPKEARERLMKTAVSNFKEFLKGNKVNTINL
jgi:glycerate dehydrogenase